MRDTGSIIRHLNLWRNTSRSLISRLIERKFNMKHTVEENLMESRGGIEECRQGMQARKITQDNKLMHELFEKFLP